VEVGQKKSKAEEREFYRDYIYPKPKETAPQTRKGRGGARGRGRGGLLIVLILLGLAGALLLFDYLSNGLATGLFKKTSGDIILKAVDYYAVETGAFTSLNQANARAAETVAAGGAGFIYNDGTFHVIHSAHTKKPNAEAVIAKELSSSTATSSITAVDIFTIKIAGKTIAYTGGKQQKDAVQEAFLMPLTIFASMTDTAAKLKSGGMTVPQCYLKIQSLETDAQTALDKLSVTAGNDSTTGNTAMPLLRIKAELTSIINILSDIADLTAESAKLIRDLNYNAVKILCSYKEMMSEI